MRILPLAKNVETTVPGRVIVEYNIERLVILPQDTFKTIVDNMLLIIGCYHNRKTSIGGHYNLLKNELRSTRVVGEKSCYAHIKNSA